MALPRWLAQVNRRVFNPFEIRRGKRPVLIHVGRTSGTIRQTPLETGLVSPGMVRKDDVWPLLTVTAKVPPGLTAESLLLVMDLQAGR